MIHKTLLVLTTVRHAEFEAHVQRVQGQLFPAALQGVEENRLAQHLGQPNGGWGDPRDHQLCLRIADTA
jgi:hypothetical protein